MVTVVPLTSNVKRVYPFQVLLPAATTGMAISSKAQAEQVRSVAVERVGPSVGVVPPDLLPALDEALRLNLALERPPRCQGLLGLMRYFSPVAWRP